MSLVFLYGFAKEAYMEKQEKEIENMVKEIVEKELGKSVS